MRKLNDWHERLKKYAYENNIDGETLSFLITYYEDVDVHDLINLSFKDLVQSAEDYYHFAKKPRKYAHSNIEITHHDDQANYAVNNTVINIIFDDQPFLIDSITMLLNQKYSSKTKLVFLAHPIIKANRNKEGRLEQWSRGNDSHNDRESWIHLRIEKVSEKEGEQIKKDIEEILSTLNVVVSDEQKILQKLSSIIIEIKEQNHSDSKEIIDFLNWISAEHFIFMGFCDFDLREDENKEHQLWMRKDSLLGVFKEIRLKDYSIDFSRLSNDVKLDWLKNPQLILNKSSRYSLLHRPVNYDLINIPKRNHADQVVGQYRFMGLYTSSAYFSSVWDIPIIRNKCQTVVDYCDYVKGSHKHKILNYILETHPRNELFETSIEQLAPIIEGIVNLEERPRIRLFTRIDHSKRYVSALVFLPKEYFNTELRQNIGQLLTKEFSSDHFDFSIKLSDAPLARVFFTFRTNALNLQEFDEKVLEKKIEQLVRGWWDTLEDIALSIKENISIQSFKQSFSAAYREYNRPEDAIIDMKHWAHLKESNELISVSLHFMNDLDAPLRLKIYYKNKVPSLSQTLPLLESLGLKVYEEIPFEIENDQGENYSLSDLGLSYFSNEYEQNLKNESVQIEFVKLLKQILYGNIEIDRFNSLVLSAGIGWRDTVLIRSLAKYLKQASLPFSQPYIEQCLQNNPQVVAHLIKIWYARLSPVSANDDESETLIHQFKMIMNSIQNIDEDRILNAFLSVILATVRTNFWQLDDLGQFKSTISIKIESSKIEFLPKPYPLYEIWVYSLRVEGIHLRGSKVARGGLRWSDRMEDFRTEVLGLLKAQIVKNSVIVPSGSKGGFVCKQLPSIKEKQAYMEEGIACYQLFIQSLLDVTDNLAKDGSIVVPATLYRRDQDDPYLVVAADKGTAKFSDIANAIARNYGFWLDDAFASGGSVGYDHKVMGITARGAWESVKRHFRHFGKDIQNEDFTVIAIGDMGGDVFGNGMLLSKHIRLQAAFNHVHIFIDPNPDAKSSYEERKRLFEEVAGWQEYNRDLISAGGGVFERSAKNIPLSSEVCEWLGLSRKEITPNELIKILLKAKVDLLYNGGIGTYIKAESETHADAKDRTNDEVRVNGKEIRAKVIGEGGNLGVTQLGRIEYWYSGGHCCTDAIDNSAGVDCSDHEVNIKILLGLEVQKGNINLVERNEILKSMTDDIAKLVLKNNYLQTEVLAMNQLSPHKFLNAHVDLMRFLVEKAGLNREIEFLANDDQIQSLMLANKGLSNPEVSVLLSYSKMHCQDELLESNIPEDASFLSVLHHYFPTIIQKNYPEAINNHYLKREIIANQLANRVINRMGISFVQRFTTELEKPVCDIVRAYWIVDKLYDAEIWFQTVESWDNKIEANEQMRIMSDISRLISRISYIILRHEISVYQIDQWILSYKDSIKQLIQQLPVLVNASDHDKVVQLEKNWHDIEVMNTEQKTFLARLAYTESFISIIDLANTLSLPIDQVAKIYFDISVQLSSDWLHRAISNLPRDNYWKNQACLAVRDDIQQFILDITRQILLAQQDEDKKINNALIQAKKQIAEMQTYQTVDLAMIFALIRRLRWFFN